jgi:hypothetical protein
VDENKEYVLLVSSGDWGDEFDLEGFAIFEKETWESIKDGIPTKPFEAYFGSNEFVVFETKEEYLSHITEKEISFSEILSICDLLNIKLYPAKSSVEYGLFVINSENY